MNALQSKWIVWHSRRLPKTGGAQGSYADSVEKIASFESLEEFWQLWLNVCKAADVAKDTNIHIFRGDAGEAKPMWENFPQGGSWILKFRNKRSSALSKLWEELVISVVSEQFEEPSIAGVVLSTRKMEDTLSIWLDDASDSLRFRIGEKLRTVLHLDATAVLEFKSNESAIRDQSSFRNARSYVFAATRSVKEA